MNAHINRPSGERPLGLPSNEQSSDRRPAPAPKSAMRSGAPVYSSQNLFGSTKEIGIEHEGFFYRLRITKQGKLILNK